MSRCQGKKAESLFFPACFFFLIAFSVGCTWVLVCRGRRYPVSATPTHMLRICVNSHDDPLLSRGEHCSPAKNHKGTFLLSDFSVKKSTKSHIRERSPLLYISLYLFPRARVSRASHAWQVRAARDKAKVGGFALSAISTIPRVRTYHTKKPSRFVHALSARPHIKVWRAWV